MYGLNTYFILSENSLKAVFTFNFASHFVQFKFHLIFFMEVYVDEVSAHLVILVVDKIFFMKSGKIFSLQSVT